MPLDPHVETLLAAFAAAGRPKVWELTPAEARQGIVALAQAVDAKDVPIGRIEDGTWAAPGGRLAWRSYTPQGEAGKILSGPVSTPPRAALPASPRPISPPARVPPARSFPV